jgi:crotonobetainyl-CoA:carnitine CoA-transferase CaiB-like acyl-CoA transferase
MLRWPWPASGTQRCCDDPALVSDALPLHGITVVSVEQAVAGPLATRQLADLGARVIKVEPPGEGDFARHYDHSVRGQASHFVWLNRGKQSVCVDLKRDEGRDLVRRLVSGADVFVHNTAPGVIERLGLGAPALRASHDSLVVVNLSGYGRGGPLQDRKAYDMLVQAEAGLVSLTGTPSTPTKTGIPTADIAAGMYAAQAALAALVRRGRTGRGAVVDVSMFDSTVEWEGHQMYVQMYGGQQVPRSVLSHAKIAPYDAYPTADGQILIGVQNDRGWRTLVTDVLGRPDLADHPAFVTNLLRVQHRHECDAAVSAQTRLLTTAELDARLEAAGVAAAQVNDMAAVVDHPQLRDRGRWRAIDTPAGPVRALLPPTTFSDVELAMGDVPAPGAHTREVLQAAGLGGDEVEGLLRSGVVTGA